MEQRPISVTIFGILNIFFGLLAIVTVLFSSVFSSMGSANPMMRQLNENSAYATWMTISRPLNGLGAVAMIAGGIGLLFLQNWARILSIIYGVFSIVMVIVGGVVMLNVFMSLMAHASGPATMPMMVGMMFGSVIGIFFGMAYPVLLIFFMNRPKVVAAFKPPIPPLA